MEANLVQPEQIEQAILLIRGQRVMLDRDLAALYGVETGNLNKAVQRNPSIRFHVSAYRRRGGGFKIPFWKLKARPEYQRQRSQRALPREESENQCCVRETGGRNLNRRKRRQGLCFLCYLLLNTGSLI
jgi:hypothetical protein